MLFHNCFFKLSYVLFRVEFRVKLTFFGQDLANIFNSSYGICCRGTDETE